LCRASVLDGVRRDRDDERLFVRCRSPGDKLA
jgi:hypothetical protein